MYILTKKKKLQTNWTLVNDMHAECLGVKYTDVFKLLWNA